MNSFLGKPDGNTVNYLKSRVSSKITKPDGTVVDVFRPAEGVTGEWLVENGFRSEDGTWDETEAPTAFFLSERTNGVGERAFEGCPNLEEAVLEGKPGCEIGDGAFRECGNLSRLKIGSAVKRIGAEAFKGCASLQGASAPCEIGDAAFEGCSGLISVSVAGLSVGAGAFRDCVGLSSASISGSFMGDGAFEGCPNLAVLSVAGLSVGAETFRGFTGLVSAFLDTPSIGAYAFAGCSGLTAAEFGPAVEFIRSNAFMDCVSLAGAEVSASVGTSAFVGCSSLVSAFIDGPVLGDNAFQGCSNLATVRIGPDVEFIRSNTFRGCAAISSVYLAAGSCSRGMLGNVFRDCVGLYDAYVDSVTVGDAMFRSCRSLSSVVLGENVKSIVKNAFNQCNKLTRVNIPAGVASIGETAFQSCSRLTCLAFEGRTAENVLSMANYPWGLTDESVISAEAEA